MRISMGILAAVVVLVAGSVHAADIAKVNGKAITDKDIRNALGNLNEGQRENVLKDPNTRRQVLIGLIDQELLTQEGEKQKLDQDAQFKEAMENFRRQYLASRVLEKNLGSKMSEKAAKKYYDSNKNRFGTDQVHVLHILVSEEQQAKDLLKKAKEVSPSSNIQSVEAFRELAEKSSRDPSAKNNRGDLGPITRDSPFVAEFKDAAFAAAEGEVVGPVKTLYGYHVIKVVQKKFGKPLEYDEVELKVKAALRNELVSGYVGQLKQQAKVSVDDKALDKL